MITIQDIADMAGVSRTTVSNVIHGRTKRVSKEMQQKISNILKEVNYHPNMGSVILSTNFSKIIGVVIAYEDAHGYHSLQDPFVSSILSVLEEEASSAGYYLMLIGGKNFTKIIDVASRWSIDGLIILGFTEQDCVELKRNLNKPMVTIDTNYQNDQAHLNVGLDDYDGGCQVARYLIQKGFTKSLFLAEGLEGLDHQRWLGFKNTMDQAGYFCSKDRRVLLKNRPKQRLEQYNKILSFLLKSGALFFSADFLAVEAIHFFQDRGMTIPKDISIVGFDDNRYSTMVRPKLTTVQQDLQQKASVALELLIKEINNESLQHKNIILPVKLVIRDSVL